MTDPKNLLTHSALAPIRDLILDPTITAITLDSTHPVQIEATNQSAHRRTKGVRFAADGDVLSAANLLIRHASNERWLTAVHPVASARLADLGLFLNAVHASVAGRTILMLRKSGNLMDWLVDQQTLNQPMADLLAAAMKGGISIAVSGMTGSGKTTLLSAMLQSLPRDQRIVTIEDPIELLLPDDFHAVRLVAEPESPLRSAVDMASLVRAAMQMRADRLVVGEIRDTPTLRNVAVATECGQATCYTLHCDGPGAAIQRMRYMANGELGQDLTHGTDLIVNIARDTKRGRITVTSIAQVTKSYEDGPVQILWQDATPEDAPADEPPMFVHRSDPSRRLRRRLGLD